MITLEQAKAHLWIVGDQDDVILQTYIDAAQEHVSEYLNRPVPWTFTEEDEQGNEVETEVPVPASVTAAGLLVVGDLYRNKESSFVGQTYVENPTFRSLLNPYRVLPGA